MTIDAESLTRELRNLQLVARSVRDAIHNKQKVSNWAADPARGVLLVGLLFWTLESLIANLNDLDAEKANKEILEIHDHLKKRGALLDIVPGRIQ